MDIVVSNKISVSFNVHCNNFKTYLWIQNCNSAFKTGAVFGFCQLACPPARGVVFRRLRGEGDSISDGRDHGARGEGCVFWERMLLSNLSQMLTIALRENINEHISVIHWFHNICPQTLTQHNQIEKHAARNTDVKSFRCFCSLVSRRKSDNSLQQISVANLAFKLYLLAY